MPRFSLPQKDIPRRIHGHVCGRLSYGWLLVRPLLTRHITAVASRTLATRPGRLYSANGASAGIWELMFVSMRHSVLGNFADFMQVTSTCSCAHLGSFLRFENRAQRWPTWIRRNRE
ncbi:hypothetical protein IW137_001172 [Coemansia sp. RSA 1287]|nr:hypothetical protein IW137_001172 [Coemansia sp. RSA 1287]